MLSIKLGLIKKIAFIYLKYKKKKLRGKRGICYTNEKDFAKGLILIKKSFKNVYCLSIIKPSLLYEEKIPGVRHNVDLYNDILKKTFSENYIDVNGMDGTCIMSDHHHLNTKGHVYVFGKIKERLQIKTRKEEMEKLKETIKKQTIEELAEDKLYKHLKTVTVKDRQGVKEIALPVYLKSKADKSEVKTDIKISFDEAFNSTRKAKTNSTKSKKVESN